MKILNINNSKEFTAGKIIVAFKEFNSGTTKIPVGLSGLIDRVTIESYPDMGLFDINILYINFWHSNAIVSEQVALNYFKIK